MLANEFRQTATSSESRSWRPRTNVSRAFTMVVLAIAIVIRVWLSLVNADSNDSHLPVIRIIAFEHRFPAKAEEWEAFQPKLYHATVAFVWRLMPTRDPLALAHAAQLVSCAAAVLTLLVFLRFLKERDQPGGALAFGLIALHPGFVGISAQATNDAFVILFASLTLYFGVRFFGRWRRGDFAGLIVAAVLAGLSKGNGLVVIVAVLAAFVAAFLWPSLGVATRRRRSAVFHGALFFALVVPAVAFIGPYAAFEREFGTPFVTNWKPSPKPYLRHETFIHRPGLTSVMHGLFTFRFIDLMRHPTSTKDRNVYPRHRTSLWTRVYAHTHSSRFEAWPLAWATQSGLVRNLTRLLFALGLLPMAMLGVGLIVIGWRCVRELWWQLRSQRSAAARPEWWTPNVLVLLTVLGSFAFVAVYSMRLRDYSSMKQIFVLPALFGLGALLAEGTSSFRAWIDRGRHRTVITTSLGIGYVVLLCCYVLDAALLIRDLRARARTAAPPLLSVSPTTPHRSRTALCEGEPGSSQPRRFVWRGANVACSCGASRVYSAV